jgi:hypothetical protein
LENDEQIEPPAWTARPVTEAFGPNYRQHLPKSDLNLARSRPLPQPESVLPQREQLASQSVSELAVACSGAGAAASVALLESAACGLAAGWVPLSLILSIGMSDGEAGLFSCANDRFAMAIINPSDVTKMRFVIVPLSKNRRCFIPRTSAVTFQCS